MRKFKKSLALLLVLCLIGTMVPFQVFAAEDADASEIVTEAPVVHDEESVVERIEVPDMSIMQCSAGWNEPIYDEHGDQVVGYWWYYPINITEFHVYYKDGTVATYSYDNCYELTGYSIAVYDGQSEVTPWEVGTYTCTAEFMGATCEFQVTIEPSPVERIEAAPVTMMVGTNGYWDGHYDENGQWVEESWYRYNDSPEEITVYFRNGDVFTGTGYELFEYTGYDINWHSDQSYENQWGVGTYTATATFLGASCEYEVIIMDTNVDYIEIADITVYEGTGGYFDGHYDENDNWISNSWYNYSIHPEEVTVHYLDGDVVTYDYYSIFDETGSYLDLSWDLSYENQWGVGSHTVTASFMGVSCQYQFIIEPSPVERIEISDFSIIENSNGWMEYVMEWDDELWDWVYTGQGYFMYEVRPEEVTVYYTDGTEFTCAGEDLFWYTGYDLDFQNDQSAENPWGLGIHTVTAIYMGVACQYDITIVESPVARIEIDSFTVIENLLGSWRNDTIEVDGELVDVEWFKYHVEPEEVTVYYKDGTSVTYDADFIYGETGYELNVETYQDTDTPWDVGAHTCTAEYMGVTCEFTVEVVEHPIDHIEVPDVYLTAGEDGVWETEYWDEELGEWMPCKWFYYFYQAKEVTVYYKDGRVETYTYSEAEEELGYLLYSYADQSYENPWSEGTYTCTAELMAVTCEYNVHIVSDGTAEDLVITSQPESYVGKLNSTATFTVGVNKEDVGYQWYYSTDGVNWFKSTATGAQTATLTVKMASHRVGQMYRCVISDALANEVITDVVTMNLPMSTIEIVADPVDYSGNVGDTATFTAEATGDGISYLWFYSDDEGQTWAQSWSTGYNTSELKAVLREYNSGRMFRCQVSDVNGNAVWTDPAAMSLGASEIIIVTQPASYEGRVNDLVNFTVEAEGMNLTYRWHFSKDGGETWAESWSDGYNTDTLSVRLYAYRSGYQYKCVVSSGVDYQTETEAANLTKRPSTAKVTAQPLNTGGLAGGVATFAVKATGNDLVYQWEYSTDGGTVWTRSSASGSATDTLMVDITEARDGYLYRCAITDDSGTTIYSKAGKLTVGLGPVIVADPDDVVVAVGEYAVFTCEIEGNVTYQWQYSNDGGETWTNSSAAGADTNTLSVEAKAYRDGQLYRCCVGNWVGFILTRAAMMTVVE